MDFVGQKVGGLHFHGIICSLSFNWALKSQNPMPKAMAFKVKETQKLNCLK
jgi:hypothetical protein